MAASGTLNFAPGETAKTVKVQLINDNLPEGAEAFSLALSNLVGATSLNPVGTAIIAANDEPMVAKAAISIDDVVVGEQDGFADFVIRLNAPTNAPLTVDYNTANSTAVGNFSATNDYIISSGALTFAPGETVKTVRVQLVDDFDTEGAEVFTMNLSSPSANATIARRSATATIIDNDAPSGTPQVSIGDLVVDEADGTANFVITLDRPSASVVSIDLYHPGRHGARWQRLCGGFGNAQIRARRDRQDGQGPSYQRHDSRRPRVVQPGALESCRRGLARSAIGTATIDDDDAVTTVPPPTGPNEILLQNVGGQAAIWRVNGATLTASALLGANPGPNWKDVAISNFGADTHPDILLQNINGAVVIWQTDGTSVTSSTVVANPGAKWKAVGTGDFGDNGQSDILLQNTSGAVAIWNMNGTDSREQRRRVQPGTELEGGRNRRLHRRRPFRRHSVAEYQRLRCDLGDERGGYKEQRRRGQYRGELACDRNRRLQWRQPFRHPVTEHQRRRCGLGAERERDSY